MRCFAGSMLMVAAVLMWTSNSRVALAQEAECKADIKTLCKDATGKDVLKCIEQHKDEYSAPCKKKIAEVKDKFPDFAKACQPDLEKLCSTGKVGDGTLGKCVKANEGSMSAGCKSAYAQMKSPLKGVKVPGLKK